MSGCLDIPRGVGAAVVALLLLAVLLPLAACTRIDDLHREACESIVAVLEPEGAVVTLLGASPDPRRAENVEIHYRSLRPDPLGGPPRAVEETIVCAFGGLGFSADRKTLIGVETSAGAMSEGRLHLLRRFWLDDKAAVADAMRQVRREGAARRDGLFEVDRPTGFLLQQFVNAAPPAALYALLAVAYSLVYGLTNRINLAFGDFAMLGAYGSLIGVAIAITFGFPGAGVALPAAVLVAAAITAAWSRMAGRFVFQPLLGRSSQPLLVATIGLSIALQEFVGRVQGVRERFLPPILAETHVIAHGGFEVVITSMQILLIAVSAALVGATLVGMRRSRFGRAWRAAADDLRMAEMLGVDPARVLVVTFTMAGVLASVAGTIMTVHYGGTSFHMGTIIGLKALVAAIVGGIGSLPGAVVGGVLIGLTETFWAAYQPIVWRDAVILTLLAVFLILKPEGILGTRTALEERERP